ncbi:UvrD-helicase domain-containing protein [Nitrosomonas supralitoralis]|uniref:DNA 3'-5' helicase n=1 Tax=Nitrosomonas supralitoralis TaxID=2116706 RepID=A0A2P7NS02_9PROT|nr:UvrD-helicase domain-containing protein [Nitrosomonas supralitoralis]PSJ16246.1 DNA helicase UvrD [Nitrosomonas supralitoralis]
MGEQGRIADQEARSRALDPSASFIVQAPAGSGKTGLLTQRFLVLLAGVDAPEEIVAITFTRKAAGEMRQRILEALKRAKSDQPPEREHEKHTWKLAQRALMRDKEQGWQLLDNPARLRIQTIDSLCTALARQMPILSQFGSVPAIAEDAEPLYLAAARNTIAELESGANWSDAIAHLIQHLDNRLDKLQGLIATMLARRDQWLRHLAGRDHPLLERKNLEAAMARLVTEALSELAKHVPGACGPELIELALFAAENLEGTDSPILVCSDLQGLPGSQVMDRGQWEGLAKMLLTEEGAWRKSLTKNQGFPAPSSAKDKEEKIRLTEMKQRMTALLELLQGEDAFREQLALLQELPPHQYTNGEWETLQALVELLRIAAAHLELVFSEQGQVDFPALTQAAIRALGEPEAPTDLALALDYRIRHLLMDEFQDTSFNQYELLTRLTAGWQPGDGHSLFVVGDPMQSIYRFREAEVGLFLAAREHGIGQVPLEFLRLAVNFRSQQGIIDWINQNFPHVLPPDDNVVSGAVSYAPSTAFHPQLQADAVTVHRSLVHSSQKRDDNAEAREIVTIVQQAKREQPDSTIAILVRSRNHLVQIVEQLQKAKLRFQAVEIERLAHRPVVQDLLALTRALSHIGDRIAWLAVLRAPFCGLTLEDLHTLAGDDYNRTIIDLLHQEQRREQLSEDGRARIVRVLPVLDTALSEQARCSLRSSIEGSWIALGGPACVTDETDLEDAEVYLQLLEKLGKAGDVPDIHDLNKQIEKLFALPDVEADGLLQLMTIHKSKGLEFDTVIMPGLGRSPKHDDEKLLHWLTRGRGSGNSDLLLAPISAHGEDRNLMTAYLQRLDKAKGRFEDSRLLYVAATRAKQRLHLFGHAGIQEHDGGLELKDPPKDSLLARLWPVVENDFKSLLAEQDIGTSLLEDVIEPAKNTPVRLRLATDWSLLTPPDSIQISETRMEGIAGGLIEFSWAGETARHVGTVVHRLLQHIGTVGIEHVKSGDLRRFEQIGRKMLVRLGVPEGRIKVALEEIDAALQAALEDERGRWILSGLHEKAVCELALSGKLGGGIDHMVIDRTFVDEHGTRWIIDYKTGAHTGGGVDEFLDRERERYRQQLERYAVIMSKMEKKPIRLGLYFPLLGGWREWSF